LSGTKTPLFEEGGAPMAPPRSPSADLHRVASRQALAKRRRCHSPGGGRLHQLGV